MLKQILKWLSGKSATQNRPAVSAAQVEALNAVASPKKPRKLRIISGAKNIESQPAVEDDVAIVCSPQLKSICEGFTVSGSLIIGGPHQNDRGKYELRRVPIETLPENLSVHESLALISCFRLRKLPRTINVGGDVLLHDCDALEELPDYWHVPGSLTIRGGSSLKKLPPGLAIDGDFTLTGTRIEELPPDLEVRGDLTIEGRSRVKTIPSSIRVGGNIRLRHTRITAFPPELKIRGDLEISGARALAALPENVSVAGSLRLTHCINLKQMPANLRVDKDLVLRNSMIDSLPAGMRVPGDLILAGCTRLASIPQGLSVGGRLDLSGCTALTSLPSGLHIGTAERHVMRVSQSAANQFEARFRRRGVAVLSLVDCANIVRLPADLDVRGPVDLARSGITSVPASLRNLLILWRGVLVPQAVIFAPETIPPADVLREPNAELRRVMLERLGIDNVLKAVHAMEIHADTDAGGERRLVHVREADQRFLICRCPSTQRQYILRVPPETKTCHDAAAWMAGVEPAKYKPEIET